MLLFIWLAMVALIWLEGVTHISNLDFLLLQDPTTLLLHPLSYSESVSLELLSSWQHFFFRELFWVFMTIFLSFEKYSMICSKELEFTFLPILWHFYPMAAFPFPLKFFCRVPSLLYLRHSLVLWVVCVPPYFWHSMQLFVALAFLGTQFCGNYYPCAYLCHAFQWVSQHFPLQPFPWHWNLQKGGQKGNDSSSQKELFGSPAISDSPRRSSRRTRGEW